MHWPSRFQEANDATPNRPLLRAPVTRSAIAIRDAGFGGVILYANCFDEALAQECKRESLSVWIDLSNLQAPDGGPQKQHLVFEEFIPHLHTGSNELDTLHPESGRTAIAQLEPWRELLTGVLFAQTSSTADEALPPFPWSPPFSASFQARHGFDIFRRLETLVSSGGDEAARVRQQYWDQANDLHRENFLQPLSDWCTQHGLAFRTRPYRTEWNALALPSQLRARLDTSAATLENTPLHPLTLASEQTSPREFHGLLRAGADFFARHEPPAPGSPPQTQWNRLIARNITALAGSRSNAQVGVLFPARSTQTHYHPDGHRFTRWVGDDLEQITWLLDDLQFDWLFVTEEQLAQATHESGKLHVGANRHELAMMIVPSITAFSWQAWELLEQFVENGGKVACLGLLPRWSERGRDRALEERIGKATRIIAEDLYQAYAALEGQAEMPPTIGYPIFREYHSGGRLCCYQPRLNADADDARLRVRQILHESLTPDFETLAPQIHYTHRRGENHELYFVTNDGEYPQRVNAHLRPQRDGRPVETEALSGEEKPFFVVMPYQADAGGGVGLSFDLAPGQSRLLTIQNSKFKTQNLLERASFEVEFYDGQTATGTMTQNGLPQVALRRNGQVEWFADSQAQVTLPTPLLADQDEWDETLVHDATQYSQSLTIPAEWQNCKVFLEVAANELPLECSVNGCPPLLRIAPPFRFDISLYLAFGASNDFTLKLYSLEPQDAPLVRLVAYPQVTVKITP